MRSAFLRGVGLLSASETGSAQSQGQIVEDPGESASENMEAINGVPQNVAQLKPVIDKLMCKVIPIVICLVSANAKNRIFQREQIKNGVRRQNVISKRCGIKCPKSKIVWRNFWVS